MNLIYRYIMEMGEHTYTNLYRKMNKEVEDKYYIMPKEERLRIINDLIKKGIIKKEDLPTPPSD
jgi:hypothetical protein